MEEDEKSSGRLSLGSKNRKQKIGVPDSISQRKLDEVEINESAGKMSKASRHSRTNTM